MSDGRDNSAGTAGHESGPGDFTLVVSGDAMITQALSVYEDERSSTLFDTFREADVGFTNLETVVHEYEHSPGVAGGTFTASSPKMLEELKWAGINLVSTANNHGYDYGEGGLLTNITHLKASGIAYSGTGHNLSDARSPEYLDTARGRVALIAASSTLAEAARALDQRPDASGRPGVNPLRFKTEYTVDQSSFKELRRIGGGLGLEAHKPESTEGRPWGQPLKKLLGAPLNLG